MHTWIKLAAFLHEVDRSNNWCWCHWIGVLARWVVLSSYFTAWNHVSSILQFQLFSVSTFPTNNILGKNLIKNGCSRSVLSTRWHIPEKGSQKALARLSMLVSSRRPTFVILSVSYRIHLHTVGNIIRINPPPSSKSTIYSFFEKRPLDSIHFLLSIRHTRVPKSATHTREYIYIYMCVYTRVRVRVYACGYVCKRSFRTEPIKATWRMAKYTRRPQLVRYYVWMSYTRLLCINNTEMNLQLRAQSLVFPSRILCESIRQPYNDRSMPINLFKYTRSYTRVIYLI